MRFGMEVPPMTACIVAHVEARDPDWYADYLKDLTDVADLYGGHVDARDNRTDESGQHLMLLEFPNAEAAEAFSHSPEYVEAIAFDGRSADLASANSTKSSGGNRRRAFELATQTSLAHFSEP